MVNSLIAAGSDPAELKLYDRIARSSLPPDQLS
jgi:hypothetical protein